MKINIKKILDKSEEILKKLKPYSWFIYIIIILSMGIFMIVQIKVNSTKEPSDAAIEEKLKELKKPKIDPVIVEKIQQLEERNVEVKALFQQARDNPFKD